MTKRRRRRDPLHSPDRELHVPAEQLPQSPVPVPRPPAAYREDVDRFWHARLEQGAGNFATAISGILALPQLRGFWPMSSVDESKNVYDLSGQGRTLSPQTNPSFGTEGLTPYLLLNGSHYLDRADEAGLDITGALTLGGWFWRDGGGANQGLITKAIVSGDQRSYSFLLDSDDRVLLGISTDGTSANQTFFTGSATPLGEWFFAAAKFIPSSEVALWLNGTKTNHTSSIPASIFNSTAQLMVGSVFTTSGNLLDGRVALPFICAAALTDRTITNIYEATRILFGR